MTIINRRTQGIYTTNWFFAAATFMLIIVFIVGNLPEYFHLTGLTEAYLTWWFAHNVLGLWITPVAAAIAYYTIPKVTGNPLYSHRIGHLHFWSVVVFYSTPAAHHLMSAPLPEWLKSFASVEGVLILVPAIAFVSNILLTMEGKWNMFVENLEVRFTVTGALLAIPLNMQGGFQQTRAINWYIHGTGWIVAHAHLALLGFSTFMEVAAVYLGLQMILKRKLWSITLGNIHYLGAADRLHDLLGIDDHRRPHPGRRQDLRGSLYRRGHRRTPVHDCPLAGRIAGVPRQHRLAVQHVDDGARRHGGAKGPHAA